MVQKGLIADVIVTVRLVAVRSWGMHQHILLPYQSDSYSGGLKELLWCDFRLKPLFFPQDCDLHQHALALLGSLGSLVLFIYYCRYRCQGLSNLSRRWLLICFPGHPTRLAERGETLRSNGCGRFTRGILRSAPRLFFCTK